MKTLIKFTLFAALTLSTSLASATGEAYIKAMTSALENLDSCKTVEDYQTVANQFKRIADAEETEWLPYYYSSLTRVFMSFQKGLEGDQRDEILDEAKKLAEKADELSPDNIEILVLNGYINMAKLSVNPALRGMLLSPKINAQFGKAVEMDPNNPRAAIMLARMKYGTAQFFKSSTDESCALAERSLKLYELEKEAKRGIQPKWGRGLAESMVNTCAKQ